MGDIGGSELAHWFAVVLLHLHTTSQISMYCNHVTIRHMQLKPSYALSNCSSIFHEQIESAKNERDGQRHGGMRKGREGMKRELTK